MQDSEKLTVAEKRKYSENETLGLGSLDVF